MEAEGEQHKTGEKLTNSHGLSALVFFYEFFYITIVERFYSIVCTRSCILLNVSVIS